MNAVDGPSPEVRLMALEIVVADLVASFHRTAGNPLLSLDIKRQKFTWLFEGNRNAVSDSIVHRFYPEEIQVAVDQLLLVARRLLEKEI